MKGAININTLLLYGNEKDNQITNTLLGTIRASGLSALHITNHSVAMIPPSSKQPDYLVLDNATMQYIQLAKGIVIFKQGISYYQNGLNLPKEFFAIVDPQNEGALSMLQKSCMQTITCGMSNKDTFNFSSIGQEKAVVSLQHTIQNLNGDTIEPCELPILFSAIHSEYALLSSVAVLMLSGVVIPDNLFIY
jgi:hypothetical protein